MLFARNYWNHEEEYASIVSPYDKKYIKVWQKFKCIEEFDPNDIFDFLF